MQGPRLEAPQQDDLRTFRERLSPPKTLNQVARGAQVDRSLLSRLEMGKQPISASCARHLARYYSRVSGRIVTAGEILDLSERSVAGRRAGRGG